MTKEKKEEEKEKVLDKIDGKIMNCQTCQNLS